MGVVSSVRVLVGPVHTTANSTPLTTSFNTMEQVRMREEPVKLEEEDDTITEEGARTKREMKHMQYNTIIKASI